MYIYLYNTLRHHFNMSNIKSNKITLNENLTK